MQTCWQLSNFICCRRPTFLTVNTLVSHAQIRCSWCRLLLKIEHEDLIAKEIYYHNFATLQKVHDLQSKFSSGNFKRSLVDEPDGSLQRVLVSLLAADGEDHVATTLYIRNTISHISSVWPWSTSISFPVKGWLWNIGPINSSQGSSYSLAIALHSINLNVVLKLSCLPKLSCAKRNDLTRLSSTSKDKLVGDALDHDTECTDTDSCTDPC